MRNAVIVLLVAIVVIGEVKHHAFTKLAHAYVGEYKL